MRTLAPFGRRLARVAAVERIGEYQLLWAEDADGPRDPRPGQFYMLAAERHWGAGGDERPWLPRAFSFCRVEDGRIGFILEDIGPGTHRLAELAAGDGLWLTGPLGIGFTPPESGRALLVGGGIGVAPILCFSDELGPDARVLLGFRSAGHAEAASLFRDQVVLATDDGSAGRRAYVTELLREELDADAGGDRLRVRPAADARGRPGAVRRARRAAPSSRWSRGWRADSARASAAWCPPATDTSACASTGRSLTPASSRRHSFPGAGTDTGARHRALRRRAARAGPQRVGHLRCDRRAAHVRRRAARKVSVRRVRVEDDHARSAPGQPAAAPVGDAHRFDQLDRAAEQGARGLPGERPARVGRAACAARGFGHGLQPRRACGARRARRRARRGRDDRVERLVPQRRDGTCHGRRPRGDRARRRTNAITQREAADRQAHAERHRAAGCRARRRSPPAPTPCR